MLGGCASSPEVGGVVDVSVGDTLESSLDEVTSGSGLSLGFCIDVLNTSELEKFS